METQQKPGGFRINGVAAILGMLVTFFVGIYIGLHPLWIPIDVGQEKGPTASPAVGTDTVPTTAATQRG